MNKYLPFLPLILGTVSGLLVKDSYKDYSDLKKPSWSPPSWIFGPVWIVLYILMGVSLYWILQQKNNTIQLVIFFISLLANILWTPIFFGLKDRKLAFKLILFIDFMVILKIISFWNISRKAALLNIPLLAWCVFATFLNAEINKLNN